MGRTAVYRTRFAYNTPDGGPASWTVADEAEPAQNLQRERGWRMA